MKAISIGFVLVKLLVEKGGSRCCEQFNRFGVRHLISRHIKHCSDMAETIHIEIHDGGGLNDNDNDNDIDSDEDYADAYAVGGVGGGGDDNDDDDFVMRTGGKKSAKRSVKCLRCPKNHPAEFHFTSHSSFRCDTCGSKVEEGQPMYGCRRCDWDECEECTNKGLGGKVKW